MSGCYAVMANTNGTAPYRGAGRPEATYVIERLIDDAARELRDRPRRAAPAQHDPPREAAVQDRARPQLRLRRFPRPTRRRRWRWPTGPALPRAARESRAGAASCAASASPTRSRRPPGRARNSPKSAFTRAATSTLLMGSKNQGQGHETTFKQVLDEKLGLDPSDSPVHRRRHRPRRLRHRHQRLALDGDRRLGAVDGGRQDHRQGEEARRASPGSGRGRHRVRRRQFRGRRHRPAHRARPRSPRPRSGAKACRRARRRALRDRHVLARATSPTPTAAMSARSRSTPRPAHSTSSTMSSSTMSAPW